MLILQFLDMYQYNDTIVWTFIIISWYYFLQSTFEYRVKTQHKSLTFFTTNILTKYTKQKVAVNVFPCFGMFVHVCTSNIMFFQTMVKACFCIRYCNAMFLLDMYQVATMFFLTCTMVILSFLCMYQGNTTRFGQFPW